MGWARGVNAAGREVGYDVDADCDQDGCDERIDRGLARVCGGAHAGGEHGCGRYFCDAHLFYGFQPDARTVLCGRCFPPDDDAELTHRASTPPAGNELDGDRSDPYLGGVS